MHYNYESSFELLDPLPVQLPLKLVLHSQMLMYDETRRGFRRGFEVGGDNDSQSVDHWGSLGTCPPPTPRKFWGGYIESKVILE